MENKNNKTTNSGETNFIKKNSEEVEQAIKDFKILIASKKTNEERKKYIISQLQLANGLILLFRNYNSHQHDFNAVTDFLKSELKRVEFEIENEQYEDEIKGFNETVSELTLDQKIDLTEKLIHGGDISINENNFSVFSENAVKRYHSFLKTTLAIFKLEKKRNERIERLNNSMNQIELAEIGFKIGMDAIETSLNVLKQFHPLSVSEMYADILKQTKRIDNYIKYLKDDLNGK